MTKHGKTVVFDDIGCKILNSNNSVVATASLVDSVYKLDQPNINSFVAKPYKVSQTLWHRRMGHVGVENLKKLKSGIVNGVDFALKDFDNPCIICLKGKQSRSAFKNIGTRATEILEFVHSDLCGPMNTVSNGVAQYFLVF